MADNKQSLYVEPLFDFESELRDYIHDEDMLREIHVALKSMLSGSGVRESDVRAMLRQQYDRGELRPESFQLVLNLIDRIVSDDMATAPNDAGNDDEDPFRSTTVIPSDEPAETTADQRLQVGSVLRDRFMLSEEVSGGSMGTIFKALDRRLAEVDSENHWVAIKVLTPKLSRNADALRALQQEAVKTRCLSHPNIVSFIDLDRDDELYYMVMEWLDGRSLAEILDDSANTPLDHNTKMDIVRQIAAALDYAHQRGVVHADVKPGNIMITLSGQAKLFDFGVARIRQTQSTTHRSFDPGVLSAVTPAYSSMQVLTGEEPVASDDVFSLACLTYRMLAGYRAFGPRNAAEAAESGMEPQKIESLGQSQWHALRKGLAFSRVARYPTPAEFVAALDGKKERVVSTRAPAISADQIRVDEFEDRSSKPWRWVALLLIFAAAGAVVYQDELMEWLQEFEKARTTVIAETLELPADVSVDEIAESLPAEIPETAAAETIEEIPTDAPIANIEVAPDPADNAEESPLPSGEVIDATGDSGSVAETVVEPVLEPIFDFSTLPAPNMIVSLAGRGSPPSESTLILREDTGQIVIEFLRQPDLNDELAVRIIETAHDGNDSPLSSGQYALSNDGTILFPARQPRGRISIGMTSDPLREPDRLVTLTVIDQRDSNIVFATISLTLQDDDQRAFEQSLPPNTIAFAASQVSVRERDAAVQINLVRFRPDASSMEVGFTIRDVTATEGVDYIAPAARTISFAPNQRSARILIPLVQDSNVESDEAFMLELQGAATDTEGNTYQRIAVMIRDDDS